MEELSYLNGPCQILPATEETTTDRAGCVKLRIPKSGTAIETVKPISIPGLINNTVANFADNVAYVYKDDNGKQVKVTYKQYLHQIRTCAKGFLQLGLEQHNAVCILGFNSPEWIISNMAAIFAGGIATGIYTTNSPEACYHCANVSRANIIVVEDEKQCAKIREIRHRLPHLKAVVQYSGEPSDTDVLSWKKLMEIGGEQNDEKLEAALKKIAINQCCTLVFTSGTVGNPKAVMLSHDNLTFDGRSVYERIDLTPGQEVMVSYLPFSHVAAQIVDMYLVTTAGAALYFADKDALKGSLVKTLQEARPTKFIGVPRVWEKMQEKLLSIGAQSGYLKKSIANWAKGHALDYHLRKIKGHTSCGFGYNIASSLILKKIKQALGLDRCDLFVSAAAPISPDVKKYFYSLDIPIMDAFGMSETSGAHCLCIPKAYDLDTIGMPIPGVKNKVANPEDGHGELCIYGRHVFMGYLDDPEKTRESLDSEGWLHTGDLVRQDERGFVFITGRLKELLITAGGENVPPVPIEQMIQTELPEVSYAVLIGDKRKFLSLLITLKSEVDPVNNEPLDTLTASVQDWLSKLGCPAKTTKEVLEAGPDPKLLNAIQQGIDKVNAKATSNAQRIQKFKILPLDFSIPTGELGPTLKLKRRTILEKYKDLIDSMYT
ncbi:hypothetical protein WA026_004614 [Henosepilachna vigintioctopunctata]|uniref:long-chain-fatty-acid--CoA ligase n=1 Tax=Henosepilachna vigintioctopunctata TaxID=420089 RepID=A0AAW1V253_9CUCU